MKVSAGCKQTEVGAIPVEWDVCLLGDCSDSSSGTTPARSLYARYFAGGTTPWVKTLDLNNSTIIETDECVTEVALRETSLKVHPAGAVLVAMYGGFGQIGRTGLLSFSAAVNQALTAVLPKEHLLDSKYLLYVLNERVNYWKGVASSSRKDPNITGNDVRAFPLAIPPIKEQSAIATALSDVDALIAGLEKLIAKKRDIKQAAMQQLLTGQTRLPGFSGEWVSRSLGSLGVIYGGLVGKSKADFGHGSANYVPFVNVMANIRIDCGALEPVNVASTENQNRVLSGDLLFNGSSETPEEVALCALMTQTVEDLYLNSFCFGFRFKQGVEASGLFLTYLMRSQMGRELMKSLAQGSTRYNLSKSALLQATLVLPKLEEQIVIATVLSDMDADLSALEARLAKTRNLKQGMMQELLTGRTRLVGVSRPAVSNVVAMPKRKPNVSFMRSVLAAEIVDQLHTEPTFGHVKFEKMLFLVERVCEIDVGSNYLRKAAGPYDNRALRSIDSQLAKHEWFEARKEGQRYVYRPLAKRGGHKKYFEGYFAHSYQNFLRILKTFRKFDTERCEIVATLFAAWSDLLTEQTTVTDELIVYEVLHNWHESKQRIKKDRWLKALSWMRKEGYVPKGAA